MKLKCKCCSKEINYVAEIVKIKSKDGNVKVQICFRCWKLIGKPSNFMEYQKGIKKFVKKDLTNLQVGV